MFRVRDGLCLSLLCAWLPTQAGLVVYFDKDAYISATGPVQETITFDGGPSQPTTVGGGSFGPNMLFDLCGKPGPSCFDFPSVLWVNSALRYQPVATAFTAIAGAFAPHVSPEGLVTFDQAVGFDLSGFTGGLTFGAENALTGYYESVSLSGATGFVGIRSTDTLGFTSFSLSKTSGEAGYDLPFNLQAVYLASVVPEPSSLLMALAGVAGLLICTKRRALRDRQAWATEKKNRGRRPLNVSLGPESRAQADGQPATHGGNADA